MTSDEIAAVLHHYQSRPLDFARDFYPEPLRAWQDKALQNLQDQLLSGTKFVRLAFAAGHGIGKSKLSALVIIWSLVTMPEAAGFATSNTLHQLRSKLWAEVATTWKHFPDFHPLFELTATSLQARDPIYSRSWRFDAVPHSDQSLEAVAGHHRQTRTVVVFDEASDLTPALFETVAGAMTDEAAQRIWLVLGNPTRTSGPFYDIFHRGFGDGWHKAQVSCLDCEGIDPAWIAMMKATYGEESPEFKVRVLGEFADLSASAFFSADDLAACVSSLPVDLTPDGPWSRFPALISVDPARTGDMAVVMLRRGPRATVLGAYSGVPLDQLANLVANHARTYGADVISIDAGGLGMGCADLLVSAGFDVEAVQFGQRARRLTSELCINRRAEMYTALRGAMSRREITIHTQNQHWSNLLIEDLKALYQIAPYDSVSLAAKDELKKVLRRSPDFGDAAALMFSRPPMPAGSSALRTRAVQDWDYNPFTEAA